MTFCGKRSVHDDDAGLKDTHKAHLYLCGYNLGLNDPISKTETWQHSRTIQKLQPCRCFGAIVLRLSYHPTIPGTVGLVQRKLQTSHAVHTSEANSIDIIYFGPITALFPVQQIQVHVLCGCPELIIVFAIEARYLKRRKLIKARVREVVRYETCHDRLHCHRCLCLQHGEGFYTDELAGDKKSGTTPSLLMAFGFIEKSLRKVGRCFEVETCRSEDFFKDHPSQLLGQVEKAESA